MFYFKESLLFIYICIVIEITPMKIHQDMISSRKEEAGSERNGGNDGIQLEQTTPESTTTTTTGEPSCLDLVGYSQMMGKWMKLSPDEMTSSACETYCNTDDTRMVTVKSSNDAYAVFTFLGSTSSTSCHLGLQQLSLTNYQWSDGTSMTINPSDGTTDLQSGYAAWGVATDYDKTIGSIDSLTCFYFVTYGAKWKEEGCDDTNRKCACECKY